MFSIITQKKQAVGRPIHSQKHKSGPSKNLGALNQLIHCLVTVYCVFCFLGVGNSTTHLFADDLDAIGGLDEESLLFEDIPSVYSASKYEQKVTEAPASISIVTSEEIQRYGYRNLDDILSSIRGFYTTNDRNYHYVGVRGFGRPSDYNSRVLFLLDGQRVNDNIYGGALIGQGGLVNVDLIDRVEVVRGPSSSLYGANAFFAIINIITKNGRDLKGVETSLTGGSHDTYKGRLSYGEKFENGLELLISGDYFESDGEDRLYFNEFDDPFTNNGIAKDADGERAKTLFAKLSYYDFTLEVAYADRDKVIPTASYETVFNTPRTFTADQNLQLGLKYERGFANGLDILGRLYYQRYDYSGDYLYDYSDEGDLSFLVENQDYADSQWWVGELQVSKTFSERHRLIFGGEFRDNRQQDQANFDLEVYFDDRRESQIWALYLQDEYAIFENLRLNIGVRHDEYEDTFGGTTNPRLALIYNPIDKTTIKLLYGEAFRAPNFYELYYHDGENTTKAALDLDPEEIQTTELILEQKISTHLSGSASVYYNEISDLITLTTDPADDLLVFKNTDEIEAYGAEFELEGKWANGWNSRVSYAYQENENVKTGQTLSNSPKHLAKLNIIAPVISEKIFAGLEAQYTSKRKSARRTTVDDYIITNLTLYGQKLVKGLDLSATVYNLFDKKFRDPGSEEHLQDSIVQDGRTFYLKLTYSF